MLLYLILAFVIAVSIWRVIKLRDEQRDAEHRLAHRTRLRRMGRNAALRRAGGSEPDDVED